MQILVAKRTLNYCYFFSIYT